MWTVVYIAPNRETAEELKAVLGREGILATVRPIGLQTAGEGCNFEVLVSEAEAEEAHELVSSSLQKPGV
ncbi:MAG: glutamate decarboxylase [Bacteroidota bacterium]